MDNFDKTLIIQCNLYRIYSHIAERKTQNMNAEIVGSAYTRITIIM